MASPISSSCSSSRRTRTRHRSSILGRSKNTKREIADPGVGHWIVEDAERNVPVGFVILCGLGTEVIELRRIAISEKGRGYGTHAVRLVKEAVFEEMGARRLWLDIYDFNERARSVYEAEGFVAESERPASEACGGCAEGTAILMAVEKA